MMKTLTNKEIAEFCKHFVTLWTSTVDNSDLAETKECEYALCDMMALFCKSQGIEHHSADEMADLYSELAELPDFSKEQAEEILKQMKASGIGEMPEDFSQFISLQTCYNNDFNTWCLGATQIEIVERFIPLFYNK
jgi:hypothetical protein